MIRSDRAFGLSELVLSGFLRVVTHPRVFDPPSFPKQALEFCAVLRAQPHAVMLRPGPRHWDIFERLCRDSDARGNLVADAYHAALAIEHAAEWLTMDRDFARFETLNWRVPNC